MPLEVIDENQMMREIEGESAVEHQARRMMEEALEELRATADEAVSVLYALPEPSDETGHPANRPVTQIAEYLRKREAG